MPAPPDAERPKTLYLVDGTSQLFRAYFALPPLSNADGLPTHAVYGFTTMLRKLLQDERPELLAVAFDLAGGTFRHERYAEYKANRPETPEDLKVQLPWAKEVCRAFRIPVLELEGYEADDLIATYARLATEAGLAVRVVASDKDLLQLVGDGVSVLNPVRNEVLDPEGVRERFGVEPGRVTDVLGLMGDSVDNIPGVPGVGEKTALAMVRACGSLENVLERAARFVAAFEARDALLDALQSLRGQDRVSAEAERALAGAADRLTRAILALREVEAEGDFRDRLDVAATVLDAAPVGALADRVGEPGRVVARDFRDLNKALKGLDRGSARRAWTAVHEHADTARLSRELATVDREVPVRFDADGVVLGSPDSDRARTLFRSLGFRALLDGLDGEPPDDAPAAAPAPSVDHATVLTRDALEALVDECRASGRVAIHVEADSGDPRHGPVAGLAVSPAPGRAAYVPLGHDYLGAPRQLAAEVVREAIAELLSEAGVARVAHDVKRAIHLLRRLDLDVDRWGLDTRVAAFLLNPGRSDLSLERLAEELLGQAPADAPSPKGAKPSPASQIEVERLAERAAVSAEVVGRLASILAERLEEADLGSLYRDVEGPLLPLLARMEALGIRVDPSMLAAMGRDMESRLDHLRADIHALTGVEFNVDSPKQLREILFDRLGLKPRRKTAKSGVSSTDARTLEELAGDHPVVRKVLDYRELAKLKGTYVDSLPLLIDAETGRIHTSFHPTGAATGRLSSSDPNLQNIPARTEAGRQIRSAFLPDEGHVFLASDYSQVELRILAHLSGDPELLAAFRRGDDVHRHTASLVFGVDPDLVSDAMRRRAKAVNFGIIYGMSETRLAAEQELSRGEARRFIRTYFERFQGVREYIDRVREQVRRDAAVRTLFGRVRYFPQLHQRVHRSIQEQALRAAVNTTVQGTAADLMKMAMLGVDRDLREAGLGARMLLQVHDELLLEVPEDELDATAPRVRAAMEGVHRLEVPLAVDQKTGNSWKEVT